MPGRRSRVVALRTFTAHRGRLDWLAAEGVFCFWRRLSLRTVVNYALIYRVARPAPIRFTEPVRIIAPRTASTVVPKIDMPITQMDLIQRISVPGDLRLVVVQRSAVLIDNGGNTLITGYDALHGIGALMDCKVWNCRERQKGKAGNGCRNAPVAEEELLRGISDALGWEWKGAEEFGTERFLREVQAVHLENGAASVQKWTQRVSA